MLRNPKNIHTTHMYHCEHTDVHNKTKCDKNRRRDREGEREGMKTTAVVEVEKEKKKRNKKVQKKIERDEWANKPTE